MFLGHLSRQLGVPMTTVTHIIQRFRGHGGDPRCGCKREIDDKLKRGIVYGYPEQLPERLEVTAEVKVHQIPPPLPM